ncbi:MAG: NADH-quinone oxidoreductase subunit F, partial [Gemmatimonadaceae bacterium]
MVETPLTRNMRADGEAPDLKTYEKAGGYQSMRNALRMAPADITNLVKESNLRGRGGAGFHTGQKWS